MPERLQCIAAQSDLNALFVQDRTLLNKLSSALLRPWKFIVMLEPGPTPLPGLPLQCVSSPSVSVFWLNQEQLRLRLTQAVQRLAIRYPEIEEVWLFGSLALGEAVPGSDVDLLIVLVESALPFLGYGFNAGQFGVGHVPCGAEFRQEFSHLAEDRPT